MFEEAEHDYYKELNYINGLLTDDGKDARPRTERSKTYRKNVQTLHAKFTKHITLPIKDLVSIEPDLDGDWLIKLQKSPATELPSVHQYNGKNIILNGNHRVAARFLSGYSYVKVALVSGNDIEKETDRLWELRN